MARQHNSGGNLYGPSAVRTPSHGAIMDVKLAKADLAYIDYDVFIVGPGEQKTLHETTRADIAKAGDKFDEKRAYVPVPVVVGHDRVPKGLDEALLEATVGESKEVVVPPEKGAG